VNLDAKLFTIDGEGPRWRDFPADGFSGRVCGVIYRGGESSCGMPLGGIGTGCMDLDTDGTLGRCSIFNSFTPPRVLSAPFLAIAVRDRVWILAKQTVPGSESVRETHYWGHYPVADIEFELDAPVSAGLRAWSPFLPGDSALSNTPGIVFEVRLRNVTNIAVTGSLALGFPGPEDQESGASAYRRRALTGLTNGVEVTAAKDVGYVLAAIGEERIRRGGKLSAANRSWGEIVRQLPDSSDDDAGASVALDFTLAPYEARTVRFVLTWYCPCWKGTEYRHYLHAYSERFTSASDVAEFLAREHDHLLKRILAWQGVVFSAEELPVWLRDQLVNVLHTITEDAFWARDSIPSSDWCTHGGIFGLTESPRSVPHVAIPSDWYGSLPLVFFFPDLFASLLRGYAHYQLSTGEIPLGLGWNADLGSPIYDFLRTTNGSNFVDLVGRLWHRNRDEKTLVEFLPAVKKAVAFMQTLDRDHDGLLDLDPWPTGNQFYGAWHWVGTAAHPNGFWIAALLIAEQMAHAAGDVAFAHDCRIVLDKARESLETKLWNGTYYLLYHDTKTGEQSDTILSNQLAGQWLASLHGLPHVFPPDHVQQTLETVRRMALPASPWGVLNATRPDGSVDESGGRHSTDIFTGETICLACTFACAGDSETAEEIAHKLMENIALRQRAAWDMPNIIDRETGEVAYGTDFYQMMILWALPLAFLSQDITTACGPGGFIDRILSAARQQSA